MDHQYTAIAIDLNNHGALQLEQKGDAVSAFNSFSQAAMHLVMTSRQEKENRTREFWDTAPHWHWLDCSCQVNEGVQVHPRQEETLSKEASAPFLFIQTIVISPSLAHTSTASVSIPILFNLALSCTILGTQVGEYQGRGFLAMAHDLYQKVQGLVDEMEHFTPRMSSDHSPSVVSKMSLLLSMAIANNCACICFSSNQILPQSTMFDCLNRLATLLEWSSPMSILQARDRGELVLNLHILTTSQSIAAAA